jgi:methionyl aminopeptidase
MLKLISYHPYEKTVKKIKGEQGMSVSDRHRYRREKLLEAGIIASKALAYTCSQVAEGKPLLDIAEAGETRIRELGGQPAFPINISINHHAAHYTPDLEDVATVPARALVKIDLGAHIHGYIADNARTVLIGGDEKLHNLIQAAEAGLQAAIQTIHAGLRIWKVSKAISGAIRQFKARPIENLTGHSIDAFNLHAGVAVPSVVQSGSRFASPRMKENMVVAIEPFTTYSRNPQVENLEPGHIFGFVRSRNPTNPKLRSLFSQMKAKFGQLPFASRWMTEFVEPERIPEILENLRKEGCIQNYAVLGLRDESFVAQAEHTIIVEQTGCTITTRQQTE